MDIQDGQDIFAVRGQRFSGVGKFVPGSTPTYPLILNIVEGWADR